MEQQDDKQHASNGEKNPTPLVTINDDDVQGQNADITADETDRLTNEVDDPGYSGDNPDRIENIDDLHEIQVADDLGEPDPEATFPETEVETGNETNPPAAGTNNTPDSI